ncbi:MAG: hypothetical protein V4660_10715 [Pseudomonadota bacterium]
MTHIQYAWMIYAAGSLGCCVATWWMFLWAWRFVRYSLVVTVMVLLLTPFAIDQETMALAPAVFTLVFDGISLGSESIKPLLKLMAGIWLIAIILVGVFVSLTRNLVTHASTPDTYEDYDNQYPSSQSRRIKRDRPSAESANVAQTYNSDLDGLSSQERRARADLMSGEVPLRAIRD